MTETTERTRIRRESSGETGEYGPVRGDEELRTHARNMAWSFHGKDEDFLEAFARYGTDKLRVLRDGGRPVAGLSLLPLGQWFGGRSLPMGGISLVGVAPEQRGRGAGRRLMTAVVREMKEAGTPISVLYPAKQTLYRRAGYELAGGRWETSIGASDIDGGSRKGDVREIEESDRPAVEAAYRAFASRHSGPIDRPDFMWTRLEQPRAGRARGFLVEGDEGVEGYAHLYETQSENYHYDLNLTDFVATTNRAASRLLGFLADHASLGHTVRWCGDPLDPVHALLTEQKYRIRLLFRWMIRIVDVKDALEGRGYPPELEGELHFEIDDDIVDENRGRFVLEVSDGTASLQPGGRGRIRTGIRGLGTIYTGFFSPRKAEIAGLLTGPDEDLEDAGRVFSGPVPWMTDMF